MRKFLAAALAALLTLSLGACGNGGDAASGASSRTSHHFHKIIVCLARKNGFDQLSCFAKAAHHGTAQRHAANGIADFPQPLPAPVASITCCKVFAPFRMASSIMP